jgi:hopanoid C-3 methylase
MIWNAPRFFDPDKQVRDHQQEVRYEIALPEKAAAGTNGDVDYIHAPRGRNDRAIDNSTEEFVDRTRMGAARKEAQLEVPAPAANSQEC